MLAPCKTIHCFFVARIFGITRAGTVFSLPEERGRLKLPKIHFRSLRVGGSRGAGKSKSDFKKSFCSLVSSIPTNPLNYCQADCILFQYSAGKQKHLRTVHYSLRSTEQADTKYRASTSTGTKYRANTGTGNLNTGLSTKQRRN